MSPSTCRVGVVIRPQLPPEELRDAMLAADAAGVDEVWLWEDCFLHGGLTAAAAALAWTSRVRVGLGLMPVPLRNPALAAMEIATLERLFPGRFVPGIGHGVLDWMAQVGARAESPLTLLREYTVAVGELLAGRTVTTSGRYVTLADVALDWPPDAVPPLLIGARGPKTLHLAGELADGAILDFDITPAGVRSSVARVREGRAASGRDGSPQVVAYLDVAALAPSAAVAVAVDLAAAGVTSVVLQPSAADPHLGPVLEIAGSLRKELSGGNG